LGREIGSGWGAATSWITNHLWHSLRKSHRPFQIALRDPNEKGAFLYVERNESSPEYCDAEDSRCQFLPISPCARTKPDWDRKDNLLYPERFNFTDSQEHYWVSEYAYRLQQHRRYQLYQFLKQFSRVSTNCTAMHGKYVAHYQ